MCCRIIINGQFCWTQVACKSSLVVLRQNGKKRRMRRYVLICVISASLICWASANVEVQCFYTEGCYKCRELKELLAKIEYRFSNQVTVSRLEITNLANYKRMMELEKKHGITRSVPMEAFVGESYLLGHDEILGKLENAIFSAVTDVQKQPVKLVAAPVILEKKPQLAVPASPFNK